MKKLTIYLSPYSTQKLTQVIYQLYLAYNTYHPYHHHHLLTLDPLEHIHHHPQYPASCCCDDGWSPIACLLSRRYSLLSQLGTQSNSRGCGHLRINKFVNPNHPQSHTNTINIGGIINFNKK